MEFKKKPLYDFVKRLFDLFVSITFLLCTWPIYLIIAIIISVSDGQGKPFFSQVRCGKNGKKFTLYKFRTMCVDAEAKKEELMDQNEADGPAFKIKDDPRITPLGKTLRATNIDEFPQMLNILLGDMSFVGTRPEVRKYVDFYTDEMRATLLLPAGITSEASIRFRDEAEQIPEGMDADEVYVNSILPQKMEVNLEYLRTFSFIKDIRILFDTFLLFFRR